ncbi:Elongator subunit elp6 [Entomortierella chlamydospora]|uniref:Elongator subunit elp6 n=1 Tax=Entomortierella chlamydospora TaxID=101097 RepID=A0A9P6T0D3_9FUNG|nr:Elongator subunit elp6 [Entomortierella chlamydospora]
MGYTSLEPHLPSSHAPVLPPGIYLSISDTQASDGNFLLHHFISNYIKADHNVVLVGLAGILVHYTIVGRKLGVNLTAAKTKGNFHFVDGLTQLTDYAAPNKEFLPKPTEAKSPVGTETTPTLPEVAAGSVAAGSVAASGTAASKIAKPAATATTKTATTASTTPPVVLGFCPKLSNFYKILENYIMSIVSKNSQGQGKQLCLILDDLSVLLNCGWPCRDILALVRYLKLLVAKVNGSLITVVHADSVLAEEVNQDGLVKGVFYEADYIIDVRGLDSGGSRDVHGQLSLLHGPRYLLKQRAGEVEENEWPALTLHYKILDNNVEVFAKGLDEIEFSRSIHAACIANNFTRVQTILSKGSASQGISPANVLDSAGYSALHYASRAGNKEICTLLLNAGADVDAKTPELGTTPLMRAVQQNHLAIARLLVSYGASVEERNSDYENIFHILATAAKNDYNESKNHACFDAFLELAQWLKVKAGSQPGRLETMLKEQDIRGQTPAECLPGIYLINIETEWEAEELPDDALVVAKK